MHARKPLLLAADLKFDQVNVVTGWLENTHCIPLASNDRRAPTEGKMPRSSTFLRVHPASQRGEFPAHDLVNPQIRRWHAARVLPPENLPLGNPTRCCPLVGADHAVVEQFGRNFLPIATALRPLNAPFCRNLGFGTIKRIWRRP